MRKDTYKSHNTLRITHNGFAHVAQSVEHFLGKEEVTGSIPVMGFVKKGYSHF